jgi:hypothetical protein
MTSTSRDRPRASCTLAACMRWLVWAAGRRYDQRTMDSALPEGSVFADRYRVDHLIGEGPRKRTYLAWDLVARRHVALAVMLPGADPLATQREVEMLGKVSPHPNIVTPLP